MQLREAKPSPTKTPKGCDRPQTFSESKGKWENDHRGSMRRDAHRKDAVEQGKPETENQPRNRTDIS